MVGWKWGVGSSAERSSASLWTRVGRDVGARDIMRALVATLTCSGLETAF